MREISEHRTGKWNIKTEERKMYAHTSLKWELMKEKHIVKNQRGTKWRARASDRDTKKK